jgi:formate/nitrite transporter FocA (FNT family)
MIYDQIKMFKKAFFKIYLRFAILAAIIYCLPVYFFIRKADYTQAWLLYVGNFLFMAVIVAFLFYFSRLKNDNPGTLSLIVSGQKEVVLGMVIAGVISGILLIILIPGLFGKGIPARVLSEAPANLLQGKTKGLSSMVLIDSTIGNFVTGAFMSLILPASLRRRTQKKGEEPN